MTTELNVFGTPELDWSRLDVVTIVQCRGLASVRTRDRLGHRAWLAKHAYDVVTIHCGRGPGAVLSQFNELFEWEEQFGYLLDPERCDLDSIREGFSVSPTAERGIVLEWLGIEVLYRHAPDWTLGLLAIASEQSLYQLACARRFFSMLVLEEDSALIGTAVASVAVPGPHWRPAGKFSNAAKLE